MANDRQAREEKTRWARVAVCSVFHALPPRHGEMTSPSGTFLKDTLSCCVCLCVWGRLEFPPREKCARIAASACKWHPSHFPLFSPHRYVTTDQTATVWCNSDAWNLWPTRLSLTRRRLRSRTQLPEPILPRPIFPRTTSTRPCTTSLSTTSSSTATRPWTRTRTR